MKTILLMLSLLFASMALFNCTNDEGEDLDYILPEDTDEDANTF